MPDKKKEALFEYTPVPIAVAQLAVPTILSSLVMVIYNLADTYFVGMINDPVQNAAVTLAAPVLLAFNAINNLFGVGSSSMMSRALGKKDYDTVYRSSAFGFYCALLCGILFSLFCTVCKHPLLGLLGADTGTAAATAAYMKWTVNFGAVPAILNVVLAYLVRAEGAALHASVGTMSGCLLNIVLDPVFILPWGLDLGAEGAGLATFLSNCVACIYFFILLFVKRKSTYVCIHPGRFCMKKEIVLGICGVGIPASIQNLLNVTGMTILNNFTSSFGADAVAAMGITQKVNMVPMYIAMGLSQGIMPLVSYNYSSGDHKRMRDTILFAAKASLTFLVAVTAGYYLGADALIALFMKNETIVAYGGRFLRGFCLGLPFLCVDFLAVGVFQAVGMGKEALLFAIMRKIVLEIPALYILNALFPLYGLAYAQFVAEVVLAIAAVIVLSRLFRRLERGADRRNDGSGITIEYCHLPMDRAFENEEMRTAVEKILRKTGLEIGYLDKSRRTFEQFAVLGTDQKIPPKECRLIYEAMEIQDKKAPYLLTELYPYLKEESWRLAMSDVSYMKVDVTYGEGKCFDVEEIRGGRDEVSGKPVLWFYPYSYAATEDDSFGTSDGRRVLCVVLESDAVLQEIMKRILLRGTVDLGEFSVRIATDIF